MRNRDYKMFSLGSIYHIYNRGDNKEPIYLSKEDYKAFISRLSLILGLVDLDSYNKEHGVSLKIKPFPKEYFTVLAYCLMPNHYHLAIRQNTNVPIGLLITKLCTSYCKYFNKKYKKIGNLFQDTFKAKLVEVDEYLINLSAYIHANPADPFKYQFSSLEEYMNEPNQKICDTKIVLDSFKSSGDYLALVRQYNEEKKNREKIKSIVFDDDND